MLNSGSLVLPDASTIGGRSIWEHVMRLCVSGIATLSKGCAVIRILRSLTSNLEI